MTLRPEPSSERVRGLLLLVEGWLCVPLFVRALAPIVGMAVLWWSSARVPDIEPYSVARSLFHNSMHVIAYGCLAASVWLAWSRRPVCAVHPFRSRGAWLIAALYGGVDEWHQSLVPGRVCSVADLLSDALGAALAIVLLRHICRLEPRSLCVAGILLFLSLASVAGATFANW